jgi:hypothetical protein
LEFKHEPHAPSELQASCCCSSAGSILVFPLINHPIAKQAMAITITTKAMTKIRNKFDDTLSPIFGNNFLSNHSKVTESVQSLNGIFEKEFQ